MWSADAIIYGTKILMGILCSVAKGRIDDKPRTDLLHLIKDAIQHWALRLIKKFTSICGVWHRQSIPHIYKIAVDAGLSKGRLQKNHLTDQASLLFWKKIANDDSLAGKDNWKQHYAGWLMVYIN